MKKILLAFALFIGLAVNAQTVVKNVDAVTFKKMIAEKKGVLIDLRTTEEIERKGMIKGAVQIDYLAKDSEKEIAKLDKKKTYLIYCAGGGRSGECAELMTKLGFKDVVNLEKGYGEWLQKGFESTKK